MMTKEVDGVTVECSPEEESAIRAEWAANDAKANEPRPKTLQEQIDELKALLKGP